MSVCGRCISGNRRQKKHNAKAPEKETVDKSLIAGRAVCGDSASLYLRKDESRKIGSALRGAPDFSAFFYPHRADSMGMICFFLDMIRGRKASWSRSSVLKACWKVSSPPTHSTLLPSRSTSVSISSIML